ncbi:filamentous hemagglutinin N-terminal domain-containing protein [Noviherbaspirillum sedimenti]|uniref:Filamentous hemagglutinin N-terminal domain-containing protein n=1 Tax=Noviherbaspirillum sedimenti TaxID=2320865 RepID=A0A3A3GJT5_9BURK|nr:filamentous hemagglutinin N-terminal domain-containing protein [Noviherbaspirillum sedimenti]RJG01220.1 filamentous hemagglutinin N-terminal domain-containing protein [Noviherbaspirillum sedimenti]
MKKNAELRRKLLPLLIAGCFGAGQALANPFGAQVVNGQVSIASQGNVLTVTNSPGAIINWQSFSIGAGELTKFVQQGASSTVLNRIVGQDPSQILGALQSNGRVLLINPNGILFGHGAQVNVGGLVASTLNISNDDFLAGRMKFQAGDKAANLQNQGNITSAAGGQIYLIAPNVENSGILTSPKGEVVLAAGRSVHLVDGANPDLHVVVSAPDNQAINLGQVVADSGKVGIYGALIRQRGLVSANSAVVGENGKIVFKASKDALLEAGSQTTATGAGVGGTVHVLGERVGLTGNASIDASGQTGGGTVLVGGDYQGKNAALTNAVQTVLGRDAEIRADAGTQGNGGKVIVWSDELTRAYGAISARGGAQGGDGGFVEVSGKQRLNFDATVDISAPKGKAGSLLLDPRDIIVQGGTAASGDSALVNDNFVDSNDADAVTDITISENKLENLSGSITLQASRDVKFDAFSNGNLNLIGVTNGNTFSILAGRDIISSDPLSTDAISTNGGAINFTTSTGQINLGGSLNSNGGLISLNAAGALSVGAISSTNGSSAGNINLTSVGAMTLGRIGGINANGSPPGDVTLSAGGAINMLNGNYISANRLKATAVGGINDGASGPVHTQVTTLNARNSGSGDIYFYNSGSTLTIDDIGAVGYGIKQDLGGQNITVDTGGNLSILSPITTDNGSIDVWAALALSNAANLTASSGNVDLTAYGGNLQNTGNIFAGNGNAYLFAPGSGVINNYGSVTANNGVTVLDAGAGINHYGTISNNGGYTQLAVSNAEGTLYTDAASQINNVGGNIDLVADKMDLGGGVDATGGYVWLMPNSSIAIDVGTGASNAKTATLELSNAELNKVKANKLVIGDGTNTGALTIKSGLFGGANNALENITSVLTFYTAGSITQDAGAIIAAPAVEAIGSDVNLMEANGTGVISGEATAGDFQYRSINLLTLSYGHLSTGITVLPGNTIRLESDSGINQAFGSPLIGGQLVMKTPGSVYLGDFGNNVSKVAADLSVGGTGIGSFAMLNSGNLAVDGSFYGIAGITTNNQNVEISVPSMSFTILENQPISTGAGGKTLRYDGLLGGGASTTTSTTSTSTSSTSTTSTAGTSSTTTTTGGTTTTTLSNADLNNIVVEKSTNTIVNSSSTVVPDSGSSTQDTQQEKEQKTSRSNDVIAREDQSGASKNEAAQKLYCN